MTVSLYDFFLLITPLRSILRYVHRTVFSTFVIIKISSEQFATQAFAKMLSYFDILTVSSTLNLESLISLLESIYVLDSITSLHSWLNQQVSFYLCYNMYIYKLYNLSYQYTHILIFFVLNSYTYQFCSLRL